MDGHEPELAHGIGRVVAVVSQTIEIPENSHPPAID
jgi:hypothetical protein